MSCAAAVLLASISCGGDDVALILTAPPELNPRIRLDGEPPDASSGQATSDPRQGPFRNGDPASELVSELFPDLGGAEEKLPQSNCFWISTPVGSDGGDFVKLSWETVVSIDRPSMHLDCDSATRIGLCSVRNPEDGRWLIIYDLDEEAPACPGDLAAPEDPDMWTLASFGFKVEGCDGTCSFKDLDAFNTTGFPIYAMKVKEVLNGDANPHRQCPGDVSKFTPFSGQQRDAQLFGPGRCQPSADTGDYLVCGRRCPARPNAGQPAGDVTYRITGGSGEIEHDFQPNVMTVQGTATLTRKMELTHGDYVWQTGYTTGETAGRWHENFSNLTRVEQVRIYTVDGGVEKPFQVAMGSSLQVTGSTSQGPLQSFGCGRDPSSSEALFVLYPQGACNDANLLATPTYLHQHLTSTVGPLARPLSWSVTPQGPVAGEVFIEFTVAGATKGSMALSITSPADFGSIPLGEERRLRVTVENIGGEVAVIDDVFLGGPEAAEFSFLLPSDPKPLPLPVTGSVGAGAVGAAEVLLTLAPSLGEDPPLLTTHVDLTGRWLSLTGADYDGTTQTFNGYDVSFEGGLAFYDDPSADFRRDPLPSGHFDIALPVYARRTPPFELVPGDSFEAVVSATPAGYNQRRGELHVEAHQLTDPSLQQHFYATLLADAVAAPFLAVAPSSLSFPSGIEGNRSWWRALLVTNPTAFDVDRRFDIAGPAAALFELMEPHEDLATIESGGSEVFQIRYLLPCPGPIPSPQPHAEFRVETDYGVEVVELTGFMPLECVAP
jgi:hypothetical protein